MIPSVVATSLDVNGYITMGILTQGEGGLLGPASIPIYIN